jgi:hypothetical protein
LKRPEGYYHQKLEPPEEPPFCGLCGGEHVEEDCDEEIDHDGEWSEDDLEY